MAKREKDKFTKNWITENAIEILRSYSLGEITIRGLHYQLVGRGMTNSDRHYKRVVKAMGEARWNGEVDFEAFSDHDRDILGKPYINPTNPEDSAKNAIEQIEAWAEYYSKNRWENQDFYVEVWIEKKALQGVFKKTCRREKVVLAPCKGYPSLTFLHEAKERFEHASKLGKRNVILYFGDHDPSGDDIPNSIINNLYHLGTIVELSREALTKEQAIEWNLPPAPVKNTDSRSKNWEGIGQVELDAVEPSKLQSLCSDAINRYFSGVKYQELMENENKEEEIYKQIIKDDLTEKFGW